MERSFYGRLKTQAGNSEKVTGIAAYIDVVNRVFRRSRDHPTLLQRNQHSQYSAHPASTPGDKYHVVFCTPGTRLRPLYLAGWILPRMLRDSR